MKTFSFPFSLMHLRGIFFRRCYHWTMDSIWSSSKTSNYCSTCRSGCSLSSTSEYHHRLWCCSRTSNPTISTTWCYSRKSPNLCRTTRGYTLGFCHTCSTSPYGGCYRKYRKSHHEKKNLFSLWNSSLFLVASSCLRVFDFFQYIRQCRWNKYIWSGNCDQCQYKLYIVNCSSWRKCICWYSWSEQFWFQSCRC